MQQDSRTLGNQRDQEILREIQLLAWIILTVFIFGFGIVAPQWYFSLFVLGLLLAFLARWPMAGLVGMALSAPFLTIEVPWGTMHAPVVDLIAIATLVAVAARSIAMPDEIATPRTKPRASSGLAMTSNVRIGLFFALFIVAAALAMLNAADAGLSVKYLLRPLLFFGLAYLAMPVLVLRDEKQVRTMLWAFAAVGVAVAAMGLASLYGQQDVAVRRVLPIAVFGFYPLGTNQNQIAEVLLMALPAMALLRESAVSVFRRRTWLLLMAPVALTLLLTLSRAGWIALGVEIAVVLALLIRPTVKQLIVGVALAGFLVLPFLGSFVRLSAAEAGASANENRLLLLTTSLGFWQEHPWIGHGPGTFVPLLSEDRRYRAKFGEALDSHGIIQKLLVENGLLGLATFGLFWLSLLLTFWRAHQKSKLPVTALWLALFLGTSAFQLFGTSYFLGRFWLPIGVGLAAVRKLENSN